ncbi:MAG TPA: hypothetical protein VGK32_14320 [Vicinamibacterales bacterium]
MTTTLAPRGFHGFIRATLIGTILQLALVVGGHSAPAIAQLFAPLGMLISLVAGFLAGRWQAGTRLGAVVLGGVAGGLCAFLGILESYYLKDVPAWVLAFGPASSALTGAIGGFLGSLGKRA